MSLKEYDIIRPDDIVTHTEPFALIVRQSHRIEAGVIPEIAGREHMARPYPGGNYDMLMVDVPTSYQQGVIPDGEEPPHGMLRVISSARENGWDVGILDAHRLKLSPDQIYDQLKKIKPKSVGLNPTSVNVNEALPIADMCRDLGIPYVLGGIHATLDANIARKDFPDAYAIVRGNGEIAIHEILSSFNGGEKTNTGGIYYSEQPIDGRLDYAPKLNPGKIPIVDQGLLVEQPVYKHEVQIGGKKRVISEATLYATDGCPFDCTFCSSPVMVGRNIKGMVPYDRPEMPRIIQEIEHCVDDLGADAIHFLDDMAFISPDHIRDLHNGMEQTGLMGKVIWRGLTRAPVIERFDQETIDRMVETGAWKIALGVESGDPQMLRQIRKKVTTEQVIGAVQKLAENGIQVKGFFIMGFPGETEEQLKATYEHLMNLKSIGMTEASVFQFKPYPGTVIYHELISQRPEILTQLTYLRRTDTGLRGKAQERAENAAWLPNDLMVSGVPSWRVREWVMRSLEDFYGSNGRVTKTEECI
jgi:radical SAM superfamily enzyme YgiQ (UPF0313 family)